ncbi:hypothetical protein BUALT_Bualt17G0023300 [Buddleja alternifolia]|uniref:Lipoxygenase n=1 Tax=Buddleja alternifolia TaxID=168488 RepID=A0AAV6W679_9LAMI|nr:hypothetical protein BUALT_Bualt17G0023300 [Buddleja alternifolia]
MFTAQPKPTYLRSPEILSGAGKHQRVARKAATFHGFRPKVSGRRAAIRAVINGGDSKSGLETAEKIVEGTNGSSLGSSSSGGVNVRAVIRIRKKMMEKLTEKIEDQWESFINGIGKGILIQLISEDIDPVTKSGKSVESFVRGWLPKLSNNPDVVKYGADLTVPHDFGQPGAILVTNFHDKEFFLMDIVVHGFSKDPLFFRADTWIHSRKDNPESRITFKNQAYLPSQTPAGIKDLRREDLLCLLGNRKEERKMHEIVYDYDIYNDLGNPDKGEDLIRPVLGTKERPYPRRCRTGRPPTETDPFTETRIEKPHPIYVPRDEQFEEVKQNTFSAGRLKSLFHNLIPRIAATLSNSDIPFTNFFDIDKLYNDGILLNDEEQIKSNMKGFMAHVMNSVFTVGDKLLKFDVPEIIKRDRFVWLRDNEFARQTLAGANPVNIELLKELPLLSKLDPEIYGPPESAITKDLIEKELNGISVEEEKKLFTLDYHDLFFPFIEKINSLPDRKSYASRMIFYYSEIGILRPIIIELSLPPTPSSPRNKYIFTHGHDATSHWRWKLAKTHVCSNDVGVHQLVNHWLRTHACTEPYIIATHRQLSSMHPVYKLLHPHMRYTMEMNALGRQTLIFGGGIFEVCFSSGKYAMELCSAAYKSLWRFDQEALPADLLRRGMAVEDPSMPGGVKLVIEDYPYAADGLLIWAALKELVESYVEHYYSEPNSITSDVELQAWWKEIKNEGHHEKKDEPWWPTLNTQEDLSSILTTIMWTASCQHAAINFGQYSYGGYPPNRPTLMRKLIPREDEEYLHQLHHIHRPSFNDPEVQKLFEGFSMKLEDIEQIINQRNKNTKLKNRSGAGVPPYELLLPFSEPGATGRGIPNSISI